MVKRTSKRTSRRRTSRPRKGTAYTSRRTSRRPRRYTGGQPYPMRKNSRRNPRLSKKRRSKLPGSKFVFPKDRAWPIESAQAARDAIKYIKMGRVRSASDFLAIRSFIIKHYPAVWKKYGLSATWQKSHRAHLKGIAHHAHARRVGRGRMAANRRWR